MGVWGRTGARKSPRLPREARVDPTCASEKLLANRLINRRLDLELMLGHVVSREEKVVASVCIYSTRTRIITRRIFDVGEGGGSVCAMLLCVH
jgi:hypothetical protein